jgi:hypothetical protein
VNNVWSRTSDYDCSTAEGVSYAEEIHGSVRTDISGGFFGNVGTGEFSDPNINEGTSNASGLCDGAVST